MDMRPVEDRVSYKGRSAHDLVPLNTVLCPWNQSLMRAERLVTNCACFHHSEMWIYVYEELYSKILYVYFLVIFILHF